jgi:hypothetical protein
MLRSHRRRSICVGTIAGALLVMPGASVQVVKTGGPPPAIRAIIDGLVQSVNGGNADAWEAYAQERFSPELLKKQTAEERRLQLERIRAEFGSVTIGAIERQGPSAPLELNVKARARAASSPLRWTTARRRA